MLRISIFNGPKKQKTLKVFWARKLPIGIKED
jgi:hypothetical protein